jgi:hypothetical protein
LPIPWSARPLERPTRLPARCPRGGKHAKSAGPPERRKRLGGPDQGLPLVTAFPADAESNLFEGRYPEFFQALAHFAYPGDVIRIREARSEWRAQPL